MVFRLSFYFSQGDAGNFGWQSHCVGRSYFIKRKTKAKVFACKQLFDTKFLHSC